MARWGNAVPQVFGVARDGREHRGEPARKGNARDRPGSAGAAVLRDARGREAHRGRDAGGRGWPVAAVCHGEGGAEVEWHVPAVGRVGTGGRAQGSARR